MKTLPKKWFIEPTKETVFEICKWFDENHTDEEKGTFYQKRLQIDPFCYTNAFEKGNVYYSKSYLQSKGIEKISIDQFRQITNPMKTLNNTVIANRKKGDWKIIKKYFEDRGVDTNNAMGVCMECMNDRDFYYGVIKNYFTVYSLKQAQQANATILEVSDIDKEFKVGDVVKVVKPCSTSENKIGHIGKITEIKEGGLRGFGECTVYKIDGKGYEHISGIELISDTVTLPKSFVIEAHKSACSDWKKRIEEVVPELFVKLEGWYKSKNPRDGKWMAFFKDGSMKYGFSVDGNWFEHKYETKGGGDEIPATEQEVFDALCNYLDTQIK